MHPTSKGVCLQEGSFGGEWFELGAWAVSVSRGGGVGEHPGHCWMGSFSCRLSHLSQALKVLRRPVFPGFVYVSLWTSEPAQCVMYICWYCVLNNCFLRQVMCVPDLISLFLLFEGALTRQTKTVISVLKLIYWPAFEQVKIEMTW